MRVGAIESPMFVFTIIGLLKKTFASIEVMVHQIFHVWVSSQNFLNCRCLKWIFTKNLKNHFMTCSLWLQQVLELLMNRMFRAGHTDIVLTYTFSSREEKCVRIVKIIETQRN